MSYFITTPIYYVNDVPHIGHAYTTIACDILSRFSKLKGDETFFLTGTDEHGQKVEKAAFSNKKETQDFVDEMSQNFRDLIPYLWCQIDDFIRTTEKRHKTSAQFLWNKLKNNDQIYLSKNILKIENLSNKITIDTIHNKLDYLINNENDLFTFNLDKKIFIINFFNIK